MIARTVNQVGVLDDAGLRVVQGDKYRIVMRFSFMGRIDPYKFIAKQFDHGLNIEFGHQTLLDIVDDRQFTVALLGLFEQALGFFKEPRIFERHAHAVGNCRE